MTTSNENNKTIAALAALCFHGLLALLFFLVVFKTPIPPFPEASTPGIEINLGTSDDGTGDVQPEDNSNTENFSSSTSENNTKTTNNEAKSEPKNYITQNTEEAPVLEKNPTKTTENTSENTAAKENKNTQPTVNASALYKGKTKNNSTGEGETGKPGDQGLKDGSVNAQSHGTGSGNGNTPNSDGKDKGPRINLANRKKISLTIPKSNSNEEGKVVVQITVDKNGTVINARAGIKGTTNTNPSLLAIARQAAMNSKFNVDSEAPEEQTGFITYEFINQ